MKLILSFSIIITFSSIAISQTTAIPDANFEQELINLGLDTGVPDGFVPTTNINTVTSLLIPSKNINDLTGIEDFDSLSDLGCWGNQLISLDLTQNTALTILRCEDNQLTSLNVTQNSFLTELWCGNNQLTNLDISHNPELTDLRCFNNQLTILDVTQNIALSFLHCYDNQLTNLDITQNISLFRLYCNDNQLSTLDVSQNTLLNTLSCHSNNLTYLDIIQNTLLGLLECSFNQLTSLDVSQNTDLTHLYCVNNQLTCLNVKNGNNINFIYFIANLNTNLFCIEVDDAVWSTTNWTQIDAGASFSANCPNSCAVGTNESEKFSKLNILPNPTSNQLTIDTELNISKMSIIDITGKTIMTIRKNTNTINVVDLTPGIYFIKLISGEKTITKKFVKQ